MAVNNFVPFANGGGANRLSAAAWLALAARSTGFSSGEADSTACNTAWSQAALMAAAWGDFVQTAGLDALDTDTVSALRTKLTQALASILGPTLAPPPGTVLQTFSSAVPTGYLLANGATVSRTTYADLYAAIGTTYNTGGESGSVFRLPDARGLFLRSLDVSRGLDTGRVLAPTYQTSQNAAHTHSVTYYDPDDVGPQRPAGTGLGGGGTAVVDTAPAGGLEARPVNIAVYTYIKT